MIYQLTTYDLKPRTVHLVENLFAEALAAGGRPSEFIASLHTEFGPLNQIVQIWRYDDLDHRDRVARRLVSEGRWPPAIGQYVVLARTEIMTPASFSPELKEGIFGPYFELRTYTFPWGEQEKILKSWERAMPVRNALGSPAVAIWTADAGILNSITHIWAYKSLQDREDIRKKALATGKWPAFKIDEAEGRPAYQILSQQNKLLLPAAFSPLQ